MTPDDEQAWADLRSYLSKVDGWNSAMPLSTGLWMPAAGSTLAEDDRLTAPYQVSHRTILALRVSVDFVDALARMLLGPAPTLHAFAQYALVRGALENAATAVWLLGPSDRMDRITNRLGLEFNETDRAAEMYAYAEHEVQWTPAERKRKIAQKLLDAGWTRGAGQPATVSVAAKRLAGHGKPSRIARQAGEIVGLGEDVTYNTWSACSGFAHGDMSKAFGLSEVKAVATRQPGVNLGQVTLALPLFRSTVGLTVTVLESAFALYRTAAAAPV